jgi:alanine-glyoxylate transaminase / serine-glyoxylate transaminase / serine-pyruvate transaminase
MGAGPVNPEPEVLRALSLGTLNHLDPFMKQVIGEITSLERQVFGTANTRTLATSAAGSGAMTMALANLLEPGDRAVMVSLGLFGQRAAAMARRLGAEVVQLDAEPGRSVPAETIQRALDEHCPKLLHLTHGETSTGAMQALEEPVRLARELGVLVIVDAVATLGGIPLRLDGLGADVCYTGGQKALEAVKRRKAPTPIWYFDVDLAWQYWGPAPDYHYTSSVHLMFGLREALRLVMEEGLEARWERHARSHRAVIAGLEAMGLTVPAAPADRMTTVVAVRVPEGVDAERVRARMFQHDSIEVGGGFGPDKGKVLRIGQMAGQARPGPVRRTLRALRAAIEAEGGRVGDPDPVLASLLG